MHKLRSHIHSYLYDLDIAVNIRLGTFFIYIGILAAVFGTLITILAHTSLIGILATGSIAVGAFLLAFITRSFRKPELYGSIIAGALCVMMPLVWLTAGGSGGGVSIWFVYELFFIALFSPKNKLWRYMIPALLLQALCFVLEALRPELVFHYATQQDRYISIIGSLADVSATIIITVIVQRSLYNL